jgi:O-acetylserine/cysteine efflux transporter
VQPRHVALAVAVAIVWGVNFVVIEIGLEGVPPLLFSALRFAVAAVPAILLLGRPRVPWRYVVAVGLILGMAKFGLLFVGMDRGMPAGLSSLVLQCQVVFTLLFAVLILRERPRRLQLAGIAVACLGMVLIAADKGLSSPLPAFGLVIAAGACWGLSNIVTRHARPPDTLRFMVWVSAVAVLPLLALSLLVEGPRQDLDALRQLGWTGAGAVGYLAYAATLFGFGAWGYLLRRYDASTVAPFSLLVPVVGLAAAWLFRGEALTPLRAGAAVLVIAGMAGTALRPGGRTVPPRPELIRTGSSVP